MYEKILSDTFPGFLSIRNEKHQIVYLNDNFKNWIKQFTDVDPIGKTNADLARIVPENVAETFMQCHDGSLDLYDRMNSQQGLKKNIEFKSEDRNPENSRYFDVFKYIVMIDRKPCIYTIAYDITNLYRENRANLYSSMTDSMTGAYNRRYLKMNYNQFYGHLAAIFDLDNFKMVNDFEGHGVGDSILCEFVSLLETVENVVAVIRLGGDEFMIILSLEIDEVNLDVQLGKMREAFEFKFNIYQYLSFSYGIGRIEKELKETLLLLDKKLYSNKYARKRNSKLNL